MASAANTMQAIDNLSSRIKRIVARGRLTLTRDNGLAGQGTFLADEVRACSYPQGFGWASHPPLNSRVFALAPDGDRGHLIVVTAANTSGRPAVASGESALHNEAGDFVWIKADGTIELKASKAVKVDAPDVQVSCDKLTATCSQDLIASCANAKLTASANVEISAALVKIDSPMVEVSGVVAAKGFTGAGGAAASASSGIETTNVKASGDVTAGGVSLKSHTHGGVESGSKTTTPPQ